jgi:hypothetical protein
VCDPNKKAVLEPRPDDRAKFLQGLLQVRLSRGPAWCLVSKHDAVVLPSAGCLNPPELISLRPPLLRLGRQGIARVEAEGYGVLRELGATPLREVLTAGGGAVNPTWTRMRERMLQVRWGRC